MPRWWAVSDIYRCFYPESNWNCLEEVQLPFAFLMLAAVTTYRSPFGQDETMLYNTFITWGILEQAQQRHHSLWRLWGLQITWWALHRCDCKTCCKGYWGCMTKRIRKPAEVLTVTEISELERICLHDDAVHRRVIAGHLLSKLLLHGGMTQCMLLHLSQMSPRLSW